MCGPKDSTAETSKKIGAGLILGAGEAEGFDVLRGTGVIDVHGRLREERKDAE